MPTKFPNVTVPLTSIDGNAYMLLGATSKALRRGGATPEQLKEFKNDAMSGDYDHVIQTIMKWVEVS